MNSLKGIRDDIEKSTLISEKVLGKIVELIGENTYQLLKNEHSDIMTTSGELAICLRSLEDLEKENEQLKQENKRANVLLKATLDLLRKQKDSQYVLNLLENTAFYDNAECDGYCLFDDIENFLYFRS